MRAGGVTSVSMKTGYKTSEFWVTTLASIGLLVAALTGQLPPRYAALGAAISQSAYALSRGLAKLYPPKPPGPPTP